MKIETCPTCHLNDLTSACMHPVNPCNNPWHGDAHLRRPRGATALDELQLRIKRDNIAHAISELTTKIRDELPDDEDRRRAIILLVSAKSWVEPKTDAGITSRSYTYERTRFA